MPEEITALKGFLDAKMESLESKIDALTKKVIQLDTKLDSLDKSLEHVAGTAAENQGKLNFISDKLIQWAVKGEIA